MRVVKNPEERKEEIINTAIRVFAENGYEKTTITDIARAADISQGLCYRYFPSKEAVYDAAVDKYADYIVRKNIEGTDLSGKSLREMILLMSGNMDRYSSAEKGDEELYEMFHRDGSKKLHDRLFLEVSKKIVPFIADMLRLARDRGEIKISDTDTAARFCVFGQMAVLMDKAVPQSEKAERIQQCMLEMLGLEK